MLWNSATNFRLPHLTKIGMVASLQCDLVREIVERACTGARFGLGDLGLPRVLIILTATTRTPRRPYC
jgi:hypothetical protein